MSDQEKPLQALAPATNDPTDPSFVAISPPTSPSSSSPPSRSTAPRLKRSKQWSLLPSLVVLLPILAFLARTSWNSHYTLPEPNSALFDANGTAIFSEAKAMEYITDLAAYADGTPRYRIVGTKEMVQTDEYLLDRIERIKEEMVKVHPEGGMQLEVWHQIGDGTHLFDFMDKMVWKKYFHISNVIVRLSDGTPSSKANAILVNAHSDSTLPSPGAADDLVGVAVMLESLRVMALGERQLTNSVVFLFNGAEESLQDASHLFITQHPLKDTIRAAINLEAAGTDGKELVFQATSEEMIRALAHAPDPYATVIASEVFQTGIVLSDTDFRQFEEYGNLTGLDTALVQNSYRYHTLLDTADAIQPGAVQHMGLNTLALLEYFTSPNTTLGNSPLPTPKLPRAPPGSMVYFSILGGKYFVVYTRQQATLLYGVLASIAAVVVTDRIDFAKQKKAYLLGAVGVVGSVLSSIIGANVVAFGMDVLLGKGMSWFRNETFPIFLFGPPALLGLVLAQYFLVSNRVRSRLPTLSLDATESSLLEHASLVGLVVYYTSMLVLGHALGVGSSYLFAIGSVSALSALVVNDYVIYPGRKEGEKQVHLAAYVVGQTLPVLLGVEGIITFLDLFVPLTGRLGADAPVDFIIASLVGAVGVLCIPMLVPFVHRYGAAFTARLALLFTLATAASLGWFARPSHSPYDTQHPKRLLILHMENTTTSPPEFNLHVASVDGHPFAELVSRATEGLTASNMVPQPTTADDLSVDWDIIYPVSQFLTTYKVPLPPASGYVSSWPETFKITVLSDALNSVKQTRSLQLVLEHPDIIWPVVSFNADVVGWDLPRLPERGAHVRHHIKSVASYGVTRFPFSVTVQLSPDAFTAALRQSQRRKGQRADTSEADEALASLRIDYSGLDILGMYPASMRSDDPVESAQRAVARASKVGMRFFEGFSKRLEDEPVDAMLLSAVAGVAYV